MSEPVLKEALILRKAWQDAREQYDEWKRASDGYAARARDHLVFVDAYADAIEKLTGKRPS